MINTLTKQEQQGITMSDFKIILGRKYKHLNTGRVYVLYMADISDDDKEYHHVELYDGTIEELNTNSFRNIWASSLSYFEIEWRLFTKEDEKRAKERLVKAAQSRTDFECRD